MKQKVKFSLFSIILTGSVIILFVVGIFMLLDNVEKLILFCIITGGVTIAGLYYCPKFIIENFGLQTLAFLFCAVQHPTLEVLKVLRVRFIDTAPAVEPCNTLQMLYFRVALNYIPHSDNASLPLLGRVRDFHPLDYAHVGRTQIRPATLTGNRPLLMKHFNYSYFQLLFTDKLSEV